MVSVGTLYGSYRPSKPLAISHAKNNIPFVLLYPRILMEIKIHGLSAIPKEAVLSRIFVKKNAPLDSKMASKIVRNIYNLGYFSDVSLEYEESEDQAGIILHIHVTEKKKVSHITFKGNQHLNNDIIEKKIQISKINWIDETSAVMISKKIKKLYAEKQYYKPVISYSFESLENGSVEVVFTVNEGVYGKIRTIKFKGNKSINHHKLKDVLVSKESWILGFLDHGGVFRKDMVEYDKFQLEHYYQSNGYFEAHVNSADIVEHDNGEIDIVYDLNEGPFYRFGAIELPHDSIIPHYELVNIINIEEREPYSKEKIRIAINAIKASLGERGFMYANVNPKMKINREKKIIGVEFFIENGKQVYIKNINIRGNTKTHENVIRREILFAEGELITTKKLYDSKRAVESLGFFNPQTGVSWLLEMYDQSRTNLDLLLQEAKTGRFYLNLGVNSGSDAGSHLQLDQGQGRWYDTMLTTSKIGITLQNSNWFGRGIKYYLDGSYAQVDRSLSCGMSTNWLFDIPLSAGWNLSLRNLRYDDFRQSATVPHEHNQSANIQLGYRLYQLNMMLLGFSTGIDNISYRESIIPRIQFPENPTYQYAYAEIVKRSFQPGTVTWTSFSLSDDKRNHPIRPSEGYQWIVDTKIAIPNSITHGVDSFGFIKGGIDARWYTPLIIEHNIILHAHGYAGFVYRMENCNVPYKELFHVGGPQNVRGFNFGQIGPSLLGSSLGGSKAFFVNLEIQCPINKAATMTGVLFYDGGAAWDTIFNNTLPAQEFKESTFDIFSIASPELLIKNNSIRYRHSVGVGVRLTSPAPIKIDWGFKLDRNRKDGERLYEVHFSMEQSY
jgi:outer membrane protein insertion porin family